jgi:hypothetical protein
MNLDDIIGTLTENKVTTCIRPSVYEQRPRVVTPTGRANFPSMSRKVAVRDAPREVVQDAPREVVQDAPREVVQDAPVGIRARIQAASSFDTIDWSAPTFQPPGGQTWVLRLSNTLYELAGPAVPPTAIVHHVSLLDGSVRSASVADIESDLKAAGAYRLLAPPKLRGLKIAELQAIAEQQGISVKNTSANNKNKTKDQLTAEISALSKNLRDSTN